MTRHSDILADFADLVLAKALTAINDEHDRRNTLGLPGIPYNTMRIFRDAVNAAKAEYGEVK